MSDENEFTEGNKATVPPSTPPNMRRMNDADGTAGMKGICGDSMEMYLVISKDTIADASFFTDGCSASRACGCAAAGCRARR